jgi:hypothetical protein
VDFDPVRAKAEGREPEGMDAATAALFPSEFEESELGLIPEVGVTTITRTVLHLSKDGLPGFKFACPSPGLVKAYSDLAFAMFQRQATNIAVQESLAELRDTLLPRLISGKLRLPEAEKSIEAAAA